MYLYSKRLVKKTVSESFIGYSIGYVNNGVFQSTLDRVFGRLGTIQKKSFIIQGQSLIKGGILLLSDRDGIVLKHGEVVVKLMVMEDTPYYSGTYNGKPAVVVDKVMIIDKV